MGIPVSRRHLPRRKKNSNRNQKKRSNNNLKILLSSEIDNFWFHQNLLTVDSEVNMVTWGSPGSRYLTGVATFVRGIHVGDLKNFASGESVLRQRVAPFSGPLHGRLVACGVGVDVAGQRDGRSLGCRHIGFSCHDRSQRFGSWNVDPHQCSSKFWERGNFY